MADLGADIELDEEFDIPLAPPPGPTHEDAAMGLQVLEQHAVKGIFDASTSVPLFFPPDTTGRTSGTNAANGAPDLFSLDVGMDGSGGSGEPGGSGGFWRQETDEEMQAIWRRDKLELTREWKKRHREAKKHRKRRGGGDELE